jgi:hypothetical protein
MNHFTEIIKRSVPFFKYMVLPVVMGTYPVFFHFSNNAGVLPLADLGRQLLVMLGVTVVIYSIFSIIRRGQYLKAAHSTFIFLVFFNTYGLIFSYLHDKDLIQVEQYNLLALYILVAIYASWFVSRIKSELSQRFWTSLLIMVGILVIYNIGRICIVEINKTSSTGNELSYSAQMSTTTGKERYPDIYYLVFDEMVGFEAIRDYWKYDEVDSFVNFLQTKGFYVAEQTYSDTPSTFRELATRLNIQEYPYDPKENRKYWDYEMAAISDNKVMRDLKALGYTTVVFDEYVFGIPSKIPFNADIAYQVPPDAMLSWGSFFDDFGVLVINNTMLQPFIGLFKGEITDDPALIAHQRMINFTRDNISQEDVPSPKFVYMHLLLPHVPFMLDKNGNFIPTDNHYDWNNYLGYYIYTLGVARDMLVNILSSANPDNPPVIILQSDHGARNFHIDISTDRENVILEDFPKKYTTLIVNAFYLPNCPEAPLTQDMNPINTFPIVFNCYFNTSIPQK